MKTITGLISSAAELSENGLSKGEIADELNVSRETASWLVDQRSEPPSDEAMQESPADVHVDWSAIGRDSRRLNYLSIIMADILTNEGEDVDLTVGIGKSGGPLATGVSRELETDLTVYMPSKYQWNDEDEPQTGSFSRNFATIRDRDCYLVDDNIDTGQTMTETIEQVRHNGGDPQAAVVLTDKLGQDTIDGVPIYSLISMVQMGEK